MQRLRLGACAPGCLGFLATVVAAVSQAQAAPEPQADLPEIVVTGTRIHREEGQAATLAVTPVAAEELNDQGDISLGDALNDLPALRATWSQANSSRFIGTAGMNWLDLRGLGAERTLVLINNRRHVTSSPGDNFVDVNTIPSDLIERVDLVTGGNSAVYGSEAVAGVVNFITRRDFEGVQVRAQSGVSSEGDRQSEFLSVTAGRNFGESRGNAAIALEWGSTNALYYRQREALTGARSGRRLFILSEDPSDDGPTGSDGIVDNPFYNGGLFDGTVAIGGLIDGEDCSLLQEPIRSQRCLPNGQPRIFSFDANGNLIETVPDLDLRQFGTPIVRIGTNAGGLSSFAELRQLSPGLDRYSANLFAHFDLSDNIRPFVEAKFVHVDVVQETGSSFWRGSIPDFFRTSSFSGGSDLSCTNPFLTAQAIEVLQTLGRCVDPAGSFTMSRRNLDFGARGELHDRDTYRLVAGFDGEFLDGWHYEVAANYGRLDTRMRSLNNLLIYDLEGNEDGFLLAIDAVRDAAGEIVCGVNADADAANDRPDCVPIDVFGPGAPSQEAIDFVNTTGTRNERAEQFVVSAFVSGDLPAIALPAGPPAFAAGAEYRSERAWSVYDELSAAGATFQNAVQPFRPPDLSIKEAYAELRVPMLSGRRYARELTAEAAGRISDYNTSTGSISAWNLGLVYAPIQELSLRANFSTSVRAPTQGDLYRPLSQDFAPVQDPCDVLYIGNNQNRAANCAAHGVPVGFENTFARSQPISFETGGNPELVEEEGESYTLGLRYLPPFLPGFALSIDYYDIEVTNLIAQPSAQAVLNSCYNSSSGVDNQYCDSISRLPDSLFGTPALTASGFNYARQQTEGFDLDASFETILGNGHFLSARLLATYVFELNNYLDPENPGFADRVLSELGDPDLALNLELGYEIGGFALSYGLRYTAGQTIGFYEEQHAFQGNPPTDADIYPRIWYPSATIHAIRGEYLIGKKLSVYAGVDNLTDSLPPLGLLGDAPGEPYESVGRYFYAGLTLGF
jgi:outer membrane receptor protein involved in Fe transport